MPGLPLLAGLALFVLLMLFLRGYTGTNPRNMTRGFRLSGGVLLALATVALATAGRINFAVLTGIAAWTLLFGARPPWQRTSYGPSGTGPGQSRGSSGLRPRARCPAPKRSPFWAFGKERARRKSAPRIGG